MNVLMNQELLDLYQNGKSKRYQEVERNRELLQGFNRAVNTMIMANSVSELSGFGVEVELIEIDNTHYGNKH